MALSLIGWLLAAAYTLAVAVLTLYGVNQLWLAWKYGGLESVPADTPPRPDRWPVVTVQIPLYNEPAVAARVIDACARLDYPRDRLEVQVLDDSTDDTPEIAARRVEHWRSLGVEIVHVRRSERAGYKAGALANGLRIARGDLVAVFDADFMPGPGLLKELVPHFDREDVGVVQARWEHENREENLLTRAQALGLDMHFAIEQLVRSGTGCFINFNGTAGIWRRRCIEESGGWQGDTLTEDLDLSYRAQLEGWRFRFVPEVEVPAELPRSMQALRTQQFRWTKGGTQAALKLLSRLWSSAESLKVKLEGTIHLTAYAAYPFILAAALLHAPVMVLAEWGAGPPPLFFALLGAGLFGFVGVLLAQLLAQRHLVADWSSRLRDMPLFVAGSLGLAVANSRAVWEALRGQESPFVRTPKGSAEASRSPSDQRLPLLELGAAAWCLAGAAWLVRAEAWAALPFQLLFAAGFGLVGLAGLRELRRKRVVY